MLAFRAAAAAGAVLGASEWLDLGDRVYVRNATGFAAVGNSGSAYTRIGTDAKVGSIWSNAPVDLRDRATVAGSIFADAVSSGNGVSISGQITAGDRGDTLDLVPSEDAEVDPSVDVHLEPGETRTLTPGTYGNLTVKPGAMLTFRKGEYTFLGVHIETGGRLITESVCGFVSVRSKSSFFFRGVIVEEQGDDPGAGLLWVHEGAETAHVEAPFRGTIVAPAAELVLSPNPHKGRFFAKRLRVQAGASVSDIPLPTMLPEACINSDYSDGGPPPEPRALGPAPALGAVEDLEAFLPWFFAIRQNELDDAAAAIRAVAGDSSIAHAIVSRFAQTRDTDLAQGLMLISFMGVMTSSVAEEYLMDLAGMPVTFEGDEDPESHWIHRDYAYARQAIFALGRHPNAVGRLRQIALTHGSFEVRGEAIRTLEQHQTAAFVAQLRLDLQAGDTYHLDRPNRFEPDFDEKLAHFLSQEGSPQ